MRANLLHRVLPCVHAGGKGIAECVHPAFLCSLGIGLGLLFHLLLSLFLRAASAHGADGRARCCPLTRIGLQIILDALAITSREESGRKCTRSPGQETFISARIYREWGLQDLPYAPPNCPHRLVRIVGRHRSQVNLIGEYALTSGPFSHLMNYASALRDVAGIWNARNYRPRLEMIESPRLMPHLFSPSPSQGTRSPHSFSSRAGKGRITSRPILLLTDCSSSGRA